jgi:hypothetical protein
MCGEVSLKSACTTAKYCRKCRYRFEKREQKNARLIKRPSTRKPGHGSLFHAKEWPTESPRVYAAFPLGIHP